MSEYADIVERLTYFCLSSRQSVAICLNVKGFCIVEMFNVEHL